MRFNIKKKDVPGTVNMEGAQVFALTPELELYNAVITASLQNQFYEK